MSALSGRAPGPCHARASSFFSSAALILAVAVSTAIEVHPNLLPSRPHPERSLTIYNSSSGALALQAGLIWLAVGLVLVIANLGFTYYLFRGKVVVEEGGHY